MNNYGYRQDDIDINITNQNINTNSNMNYNNNINGGSTGILENTIVEAGQERVVNRTFIHEVPHICPVNTRIINNHIYRHTYEPRYTCCEENRVCQENMNCCSKFR